MARLKSAAFLAVLLIPFATQAQDKTTRQAERRIATILTEFNVEMREYERELKYFQHVPEFKALLDLHTRIVTQSAEMKKLDTEGRGSGSAVLELAREMDRTVRQLDTGTGRLEQRARSVASTEDRTVAGRMKSHAAQMVKTVDQLIALFR